MYVALRSENYEAPHYTTSCYFGRLLSGILLDVKAHIINSRFSEELIVYFPFTAD
jgi:hypothetical protein